MRSTILNSFRKVSPQLAGLFAVCFVYLVLADVFLAEVAAQTSSRIKFAKPIQELDDIDDEDDEDSNDESDANKKLILSLDAGADLNKPIMDIQLKIIDYAATKPADESQKLFEMSYSTNYPNTFQHRLASWCAPNIRYQPLYFEDVGLERYGYNYRGDFYQPLASGFYFAKSFTLLTLNMARQRPSSCTTPLGFCRPGGPAPQIEPKWLRRR